MNLINVRYRSTSTDYLFHELIPNEMLLAHQFVLHQMLAAHDHENIALFKALKCSESKYDKTIFQSMNERTKYGKEL